MKVAVIQSNYLPWCGYFDIIRSVDAFVFYDDVPYSSGTWRNRNRVELPDGRRVMLTVPVHAPAGTLISDVTIDGDAWRRRHFETMKQAYRKTPFWKEYLSFFNGIYSQRWHSLSALNQFITRQLYDMNYVHIRKSAIQAEFYDSSWFRLRGHKTERLIDLLKQIGATEYITGPAGLDYFKPEEFTKESIKLTVFKYNYAAEYFGISAIDQLFSAGQLVPGPIL